MSRQHDGKAQIGL